MRTTLLLAVLWLLAGMGAPALAHPGGTTGYVTVTVSGQTVRYSLSLTADALAAESGADTARDRLAATVGERVGVSADGRDCAPVPGEVTRAPDRATVEIVVLYACAAPVSELAIRDGLNDVLGPDHHTLARVEWPGGSEQLAFDRDRREARIAVTPVAVSQQAATGAGGVFVAYMIIGVEHILLGFDHMLFVLALILGGGRLLTLLAVVTAFTVAHSVTLGLSVLGIVAVRPEFVEPVIALSIAYVAAENLFMRNALSRRWAVGFLFGLVHGLGFAGALQEVGLPTESLVTALVGFNLGVEAGQAFIVAVFLPILVGLRRLAWERRIVTASSAAIMAVGVALLVERVMLGGA